MNKAQFIEKLANETSLPRSQAESVMDAALELIKKSVSKGEEIKFVGFGTFDRAFRKQRNGRNPLTGKPITIPESRVPRFRPGKEFRSIVKKK